MRYLKDYCLMATLLFSLMFMISSCEDDDDNAPANEVQFDNIALTGGAVQPNQVTTTGSGTLDATYNKETKILSYNVSWTLGNANDETTGMHFHGPASVSENAGVAVPITLPNKNSTGTVSGETRVLTQDEENDLLNGLWYLNTHSTTNPGGELRGQLD